MTKKNFNQFEESEGVMVVFYPKATLLLSFVNTEDVYLLENEEKLVFDACYGKKNITSEIKKISKINKIEFKSLMDFSLTLFKDLVKEKLIFVR